MTNQEIKNILRLYDDMIEVIKDEINKKHDRLEDLEIEKERIKLELITNNKNDR